MALSVGTKAPDFSLKSKQASGLVDVKLSSNFGNKNTLLLFFPLAFTSVCTQEMCDITQGINAYTGLNAVTARAAFIIDKNGAIQYSEQTPKVKNLPNFHVIKETLSKLK